MVKTSVLNDALKSINNAEKAGQRQVMIRPSSKVIVKFLSVMQKHGMHTPLSYISHPGLITRQWFRFNPRLLPFKFPEDQHSHAKILHVLRLSYEAYRLI